MPNDMSNFMGWGFGFGWLFMILVWALIIIGIVAIVKWLTGASGRPQQPPARTALDMLKERYARGEIDQAEFVQKKRDLEA